MLSLLLYPFALLYSIIIKIRNFLFDNKVIKSTCFSEVIIITVGNITVGGTGKTPLTEYLIKILKNKFRIAILSRGYKRKTKGFLYVTPFNTHEEVGDEPLQISNKYSDITVAVCANRVKGIQKIITDNKIDIIILDDAFQHRKLSPKFSILLTTYNNPYFKDKFLPVGKLRDNRSEYKRAKILITTKSPKEIKPIEHSIWQENIKLMSYQHLFFSTEKYKKLVNVFYSNNHFEDESFSSYTVLVISGIANSSNFINQIKKKYSKKIIHLEYNDHKNFSKKDVQKITKKFNNIQNKKIIITTEKDGMRLKKINFQASIKENMFYLPIEIDFLFNSKNNFNSLIFNLIKS